ncbi:hypothetical protein [Gaetbulibacter saemankumensis]|uniref:hypothetical protein n=1 Tax=Gaetbulibacter saemankumensis TaxID=311208 RepID=UPI00041B796F|nr:hypothetical protein [Gaetbulibacter saemankumensis]
MQFPFRSEIRNSPCHPTIKIYLSDESLDDKVRDYLIRFNEIESIEIRESVERNRADENITIFLKNDVDIMKMKSTIDSSLWWYFEKEVVD